MSQIPLVYQYVGALAVFIVGAAIWLKAGKWWGLIPMAGAAYWAFLITKPWFS